jgi:hypothetical protein
MTVPTDARRCNTWSVHSEPDKPYDLGPMRQSDRVKLHFGPYRAPYVRRGRRIMCVLRGEVLTDGMTDARIPWPIGRGGRTRSIVLCGDLEKAVERESFQAITY